jgi:hypothetical protein
MIADVLVTSKLLGGQLFYAFAKVLIGWTHLAMDFAETTRVNWNSSTSIVTATTSPCKEATAASRENSRYNPSQLMA